MKRYTLALFIVLAASNLAASTRRRAAVTEPQQTTSAQWLWTAQEYCTMAEASAVASTGGQSTDDAPLIVPTLDAQPRYIVFRRVYADFITSPDIPLQWQVYSDPTMAYQSYWSGEVKNRGMVTTANGEQIVWAATGTMQCR